MRLTPIVFCTMLAAATLVASPITPAAAQDVPVVLARVDVPSDASLESLGIPVYHHYLDAAGQEHVLTITEQSRLGTLGLPFLVIDGASPKKGYIVAHESAPGAIGRLARKLPRTVLYIDGKLSVLAARPGLDRLLPEFELKRINRDRPVSLVAPAGADAIVFDTAAVRAATDASVVAMMAQVQKASLVTEMNKVTGVTPVTVQGSTYTIATRHTTSGTPITKATQYMFEQMKAAGFTPTFQSWSLYGYSGRNIIVEIKGQQTPSEIVVMSAHLDNMPKRATAPGADDNASGSVAVLTAARIIKKYVSSIARMGLNRTVRFVLFTGEEQGLIGSEFYATKARAKNEKIVAVLNLDMISFNTAGSTNGCELHTRIKNNAGDLTIANTFVSVVKNYGVKLVPIILSDGVDWSDHSSFWDQGYPAITGIEDDTNDGSTYYHTVRDKVGTIDFTYYTSYVQAALGTVLHLAGPPKIY